MLRLLSSKAQTCKDFWKPYKPCHVGIHYTALAEYSQMSSPICQGFSHFLGFLHHFALGKSATSSIVVNAKKCTSLTRWPFKRWLRLGKGAFQIFMIQYNIGISLMVQYLNDIFNDTFCLLGTLTRTMLRLNFCEKRKDAKIFEKHRNPVMLVLIRQLSLSTLRWVPMCLDFSHFKVFFSSLWIGQTRHPQPKHYDMLHLAQSTSEIPLIDIELPLYGDVQLAVN